MVVHIRSRSSRGVAYLHSSSQVNGLSSREFKNSKWAYSARAPAKVNGKSSPHYDSRSRSQSGMIFHSEAITGLEAVSLG